MLSLLRLPQFLLFVFLLANALLAVSSVNAAPTDSVPVEKRDTRYIYAIAHKILSRKALKAALDDGSNALEFDLTAWKNGDKTGNGAKVSQWWLDHNGDGKTYGEPAEQVFAEVARMRGQGKTISFIIHDIKHVSDGYCAIDSDCGIQKLMSLSREYFQPHSIRTIYGFTTKDVDTEIFEYVSKNLNEYEAVRITGKTNDVLDGFARISIPEEKKIIDNGRTKMSEKFGDCDSKKSKDTCPQLVQAVKAKDEGKFGKVWAWTAGSADSKYVRTLLDRGVDGIVYGYAMAEYDDAKALEKIPRSIKDWVESHSGVRMAGQLDPPWGKFSS